MAGRTSAKVIGACLALIVCIAAQGATADPVNWRRWSPPKIEPPKWLKLQFQATDVYQYKPRMTSPFAGANSLPGHGTSSNTVDTSTIVGLRPWKGGQAWFDLDMNQGFAPGNTLGAAGYVNGEGAKVGHNSPYYRP